MTSPAHLRRAMEAAQARRMRLRVDPATGLAEVCCAACGWGAGASDKVVQRYAESPYGCAFCETEGTSWRRIGAVLPDPYKDQRKRA